MKLITWDGHNINDGTNYVAVLNANFYGLPGINAILGMRQGSWPILGGVERRGRELNFEIYIRSGSSLELAQWFDPEDETAKQLIAEDTVGGAHDRFVNALCTEFREVPFGAGLHYAVTLQIDGDVRWREPGLSTEILSVTASGDTQVVNNQGQDLAFPLVRISPTGARASGGFAYKRFTIVKWNVETSATNYPSDIVNNSLDTDALTTAKMQADGDDLRIYVNGVEVDRWLQDMDTASTQVWINLDFEANISLTLNDDHDDAVTTIYVYEDITNMPNSGILYIGTELITYTGKNNQEKKFTGCARGAKGTSAAAHSDTDATYWIQHDIWVYYGDSTLSAPTVDDDYKPMFELDSVNAEWTFANFRETVAPTRSSSWIATEVTEGIEFYGGNQGATADPAVEIGIHSDDRNQSGVFFLINPCGITAANFTNGEHYHDTKTNWNGLIVSSLIGGVGWSGWGTEYTIPDPTTDATWDTWSRNETLASGSIRVGLWNYGGNVIGEESYLEAADCVVTIGNEPTIVIGAEQGNYTLSCKITNNTNGYAIEVDFDMELDEDFEIDTDEKTVIYRKDESNQFNALDLTGGPRVNWLPLDVGNNTLQFDDVGTGNVTVDFFWYERYYE